VMAGAACEHGSGVDIARNSLGFTNPRGGRA
jgi:hypothetical protein